MKNLLTYLLLFIVSSSAYAQLPYTLTVLNEPYVPLSGATSINHGIVWDEINWWAVSLGFSYQMDTISRNIIYLQGPANILTDTSTDEFISSGFISTDANLLDRGWGTTTSLSPLRYTITGAPGNRIFKYEVYNAGFEGEYDSLGTLNDSTDIQFWLYEGSDIVELRYGPSRITHAGYDFTLTVPGETTVSYVKDINYGAGHIFGLNGDPTNPSITDFYVDNDSISPFPPKALSSFPPNGTVYRFTPIPSAVASISTLGSLKVFPNPVKDKLEIQNLSKGATIQMYDMLGRTLLKTEAQKDGSTILNTNGLLSGIYILECTDAASGQKESMRIIKE